MNPTPDAEAQAELVVAADYRRECIEFMNRAIELRKQANACDMTASDLRTLAISIERRHRGVDPLPPVGLG